MPFSAMANCPLFCEGQQTKGMRKSGSAALISLPAGRVVPPTVLHWLLYSSFFCLPLLPSLSPALSLSLAVRAHRNQTTASAHPGTHPTIRLEKPTAESPRTPSKGAPTRTRTTAHLPKTSEEANEAERKGFIAQTTGNGCSRTYACLSLCLDAFSVSLLEHV